MPVARVVNPHITCYVRAQDEGDETANPPRRPTLQELRREHDLGSYPVEKLEELLGEIEGTIQEWIANNPPAGV